MRVAPTVAKLLDDRAVQAQVRRGAVPEPQWRDALRAMCQEARAEHIVPEQLLVELKQALGILCDTYGVPHGAARTDFTSRVVTLCIEEYFATGEDTLPAREPTRIDRLED
jgi:hypothetical protein